RRAGAEETRPGGAGEPETSRPLGRGEGLARQERGQSVRRAAATAVHRPRARGEAGGAPDGRALLRPRSDRDGEDRGPDLRSEERLHAGDRDAQYATGREGRGDDRLHVLGKTHRSRPHSRTFRAAGRGAHRELHHREVWVVPQAAERKALATGLQKLNENMLTLAELTLQFRDKAVVERGDVARIREMADRTISMVDTAIDAFVRRNAETVRNMIEVDDAVDQLHDENFRDLVRRMSEGQLSIETGARYLLVNRYFERIADHAVNIGLRVVYMVTGDWLPRIRAADRARRHDGTKEKGAT